MNRVTELWQIAQRLWLIGRRYRGLTWLGNFRQTAYVVWRLSR